MRAGRACPQRGSNPCYRLERAASWTARRWGLVFAGGGEDNTCRSGPSRPRRGRRSSRPWRRGSTRGPAQCHSACMTARPRLVPAVAAALLLSAGMLAGCGGDDDTESGGTTASSTSTSSSAESTTTAPTSAGGGDTDDDGPTTDPSPFPANTDPDTATASSGALLTVTDMRIGRHDGFDRVVFEFGGTGTPGWDVRYVDAATSQGSGAPIDVDGLGDPAGRAHRRRLPRRHRRRGVLRAAAGRHPRDRDGHRGGVRRHVRGADRRLRRDDRREAPFRVYLLEDPVRVVLEVADGG